MAINDWHSPYNTIESFREEFADKSDEFLFTIAETWKGQKPGIAAQMLLQEKRREIDEIRHREILKEVKKHWSVTPGFWISVVAMLAACIAAYPVVRDTLRIVPTHTQTPQTEHQYSLSGTTSSNPPTQPELTSSPKQLRKK